jgi:hypothetical protein
MDYMEAIESDVSAESAMHEMRKHGAEARIASTCHRKAIIGRLDGALSFEHVAWIDGDGNVSGAEILAWLGY